MVTCAQCRQEVLEADLLGDEEECLLRDHLLLVQPRTISARDPRRVAQAFRRHRIAAAGSVAASTVRSAGARSRPRVQACGPPRPRRGGLGWTLPSTRSPVRPRSPALA